MSKFVQICLECSVKLPLQLWKFCSIYFIHLHCTNKVRRITQGHVGKSRCTLLATILWWDITSSAIIHIFFLSFLSAHFIYVLLLYFRNLTIVCKYYKQLAHTRRRGLPVSSRECAIPMSRYTPPFCVPPAWSKEAREDAKGGAYRIIIFVLLKNVKCQCLGSKWWLIMLINHCFTFSIIWASIPWMATSISCFKALIEIV